MRTRVIGLQMVAFQRIDCSKYFVRFALTIYKFHAQLCQCFYLMMLVSKAMPSKDSLYVYRELKYILFTFIFIC